MTAADHNDDVARHADRLYAARTAMAETARSPPRIGIAAIVQFLDDPRRSLSVEEQRALFADPQLRADYQRLKAKTAVAELPALAAASAGAVNARRFEGGSVSIHPSRVPGQSYVIVRFSWSAGPPRMMLLESADGTVVKRTLQASDTPGEIMMVLDERSAEDAGFLRLLSDPTSTGAFML
jgi:hypothetical protein